MGRDKKKVFVSYVRANSDDVDRICETFRKSGIDYWLDRDQMEGGKIWKHAIRDAIAKGAFFLACFSDKYKKKKDTYMNEELLLGVEILRSKPYNSGWFIPVKLSRCKIPPLDIGAGKTLQDIQYFCPYEDWNREMARLVDLIKRKKRPIQTWKVKKYAEKEYTYRGLKSLIESGSGVGFHNADMGHPAYVLGASGQTLKDDWGDSPEENLLYKMLSQLSKELKKAGIEELRYVWWYDFSEWKDFCKFAVEIYNKKRRKTYEE